MESPETSQEQSGCDATEVKMEIAESDVKIELEEISQEQQSEWTRVEIKVEQDDHGEEGTAQGVSSIHRDSAAVNQDQSSSSGSTSDIPDMHTNQFPAGVQIKKEIDADDQTEDVHWQWDGSGKKSLERSDGQNSTSTGQERYDAPSSLQVSAYWQRDGGKGLWQGGNSLTVNPWLQRADVGNIDVENCLRFSREVFGSAKPECGEHESTSFDPTSQCESRAELSKDCDEDEGSATFDPASQYECNMDVWKGNEHKMHSTKIRYVCCVCLKEFKKQSNWEAHTRRHQGVKPFACKMCSDSFDRKAQLDLHMRQHDKYRCKICSETFARKGELSRHMMSHGGPRNHACKLCPKAFNRGSHLKTHMLTHSVQRPFACDLCPKTFRRKKDLEQHVTGKTHSGPKNQACTLCDEKFRMKKELYEHIKVAHTGEKPYACKLCPKAFIQEYDLELHVKRHSNERKFQCEKCSRAFKSRGELKTHMIIHSEDRPHVCDVCSMPFKRKTSLSAHMKNEHPEPLET